ncbi:MAG: hypothetical protein DRP30_00785 [Thermotoga sp.]|nr:MAG: hypothetical protein DRP30_00785 [Thermotoga sp.]
MGEDERMRFLSLISLILLSSFIFAVDLNFGFDNGMFSMGMGLEPVPVEFGFLMGEKKGLVIGLKGKEFLSNDIGFMKLNYGELNYLLKIGIAEKLFYDLNFSAQLATPPIFYNMEASLNSLSDTPEFFGDLTLYGSLFNMRGFSNFKLDLGEMYDGMNLKFIGGMRTNNLNFLPGFFLDVYDTNLSVGYMMSPFVIDEYGMNGLRLKLGADFSGSPYMGFEWFSSRTFGNSRLEFSVETGITDERKITSIFFKFKFDGFSVSLGTSEGNLRMKLSIGTSF